MPSLFGDLVARLAPHPENVASEALAYLLSGSDTTRGAFEAFLARADGPRPIGLHYATQAAGDDGAIPDVAGFGATGEASVFLEVKFWAGLTINQPVTYLNRLPLDGLLLFVAPSVRLDLLWVEVCKRVTDHGWEIVETTGPPEYRRARLNDGRTLALTSWRHLLNHLIEAATAAGEADTRADLAQLQGLCDHMDSTGFHPIQPEELSGSVAVRLVQYLDLIERACNIAVERGFASKDGLWASAGTGWWGRYIAMAGATCLLRLNVYRWAEDRATPIWLRIGYKGTPPAAQTLSALAPLRAEPGRVFVRKEGFVDVAIDLPVGQDRDQVVNAMARQMAAVAELPALRGRADP